MAEAQKPTAIDLTRFDSREATDCFKKPDRFRVTLGGAPAQWQTALQAAARHFKERNCKTMNNMNTKMKSQQLVKMAMMAALACVVGLIRFPLIPAVSFLTYDFADIPILITTFAFGPASGMLVLGVVSFIQAFLMGGDGFYGFILSERFYFSKGVLANFKKSRHTKLCAGLKI